MEFSLQPKGEKKIWKVLELDIPGALREGNDRWCSWDLTPHPEPQRRWGRLWWLLLVMGLVCLWVDQGGYVALSWFTCHQVWVIGDLHAASNTRTTGPWNHMTPGQGAASEVALTPSNLKLWSQDCDYNSFDDKMTVNNYSTVSILFFNLIDTLINIVYQYKWYAFTSALVIFVEGSALCAFKTSGIPTKERKGIGFRLFDVCN